MIACHLSAGSDKSSGYKYHISWELCRNAVRSNKYTPTWRYLEIIFSRHYGSGKNNRGFVAGYISYGEFNRKPSFQFQIMRICFLTFFNHTFPTNWY